MRRVVIPFAVLISLIGIGLLIYPLPFIEFIQGVSNHVALFILAIVGRVFLGSLLIKAAPDSKYPVVIKILGVLAIVSAAVLLLVGHENFHNFLDYIIPLFKSVAYIGGIFALGFGVFLIYAFIKRKETPHWNY